MNFDEIIKGVEQNDRQSIEILAFMHETGRFPGGASPQKAVELYEKLANPPHNSARAMMRVGMIYCSGKCISGSIGRKDIDKGRGYIRQSFDKVDTDNPLDIQLCVEVGQFIGQGDATEGGRSMQEDIKMSIKFLEKALQNEDAIKQIAKDGEKEQYLTSIKDYLKNRIELLENEEKLAETVGY